MVITTHQAKFIPETNSIHGSQILELLFAKSALWKITLIVFPVMQVKTQKRMYLLNGSIVNTNCLCGVGVCMMLIYSISEQSIKTPSPEM